jgi:hypothetical protein
VSVTKKQIKASWKKSGQIAKFRAGEKMTPEQSKRLSIGARNGDQVDLGRASMRRPADGGTVTTSQARYLTIKWDDGHESFTGHNEMKRIDLALERKQISQQKKA